MSGKIDGDGEQEVKVDVHRAAVHEHDRERRGSSGPTITVPSTAPRSACAGTESGYLPSAGALTRERVETRYSIASHTVARPAFDALDSCMLEFPVGASSAANTTDASAQTIGDGQYDGTDLRARAYTVSSHVSTVPRGTAASASVRPVSAAEYFTSEHRWASGGSLQPTRSNLERGTRPMFVARNYARESLAVQVIGVLMGGFRWEARHLLSSGHCSQSRTSAYNEDEQSDAMLRHSLLGDNVSGSIGGHEGIDVTGNLSGRQLTVESARNPKSVNESHQSLERSRRIRRALPGDVLGIDVMAESRPIHARNFPTGDRGDERVDNGGAGELEDAFPIPENAASLVDSGVGPVKCLNVRRGTRALLFGRLDAFYTVLAIVWAVCCSLGACGWDACSFSFHSSPRPRFMEMPAILLLEDRAVLAGAAVAAAACLALVDVCLLC